MDDDIEDLIGEVKYTDSSKSISTSIVYSYDFSDSSPERDDSSGIETYDSSGKDTYVIDRDESDSEDTEKTYMLQLNKRSPEVTQLYPRVPSKVQRVDVNVQSDAIQIVSRSASTSLHRCSVVAHETYTQTSKTIIELAKAEGLHRDTENLQTQTSFISITENKTVQYRIDVGDASNINFIKLLELNNKSNVKTDEFNVSRNIDHDNVEIIKRFGGSLIPDENYNDSDSCSVTDDSYIQYPDNLSDDVSYASEPLVNDEVEDLYNKVLDNYRVQHVEQREFDKRNLATLTPVTEESAVKSIIDITPNELTMTSETTPDQFLFYDDKTKKMLPSRCVEYNKTPDKVLKLPPIKKNLSCPNSPHTNLFSFNNQRPLSKSDTLPCLFESPVNNNIFNQLKTEPINGLTSEQNTGIGEWTIKNHNKSQFQLPPINANGNSMNSFKLGSQMAHTQSFHYDGVIPDEPICINERIRELKIINRSKDSSNKNAVDSGNNLDPTHSATSLILTVRCCDTLCVELLRRLSSQTWLDIVATLQDIPKTLNKYWENIPEQRIAELLRRVTSIVESPRTQVAKAACTALAVILQNTNYTKKPDFYEAIAILICKTGSYSQPVRRAANLALDRIVSAVDLKHTVTALCIHGVSHKSGLVRSASARLLVVGAALGGGGRALLRTRPSSAAAARRLLLRSLSSLLEDKNNETRKYSERLYSILRPLRDFEAYYLNDVNIETATRQMKKFDQMMINGPTPNVNQR